MNQEKRAKRIVRSLSVQEKLFAINRVHNGESKAAVARDIDVPESTLRGWCKNENKLRASACQQNTPSPDTTASEPPSDVPLDFSNRDRTTPSPNLIKSFSYSPANNNEHSPPVKSVEEDMSCWMQLNDRNVLNESAVALAPDSPVDANSVSTNASWFWKWYKSDGAMSQLRPGSRGSADFVSSSWEDADSPSSAVDASYHGEKFLRWLENCSDPAITTFQILQFRCLLNSVRECAERHRPGRVNKVSVRRRSSRK